MNKIEVKVKWDFGLNKKERKYIIKIIIGSSIAIILKMILGSL